MVRLCPLILVGLGAISSYSEASNIRSKEVRRFVSGDSILYPGQRMYSDQVMVSPDQNWALAMVKGSASVLYQIYKSHELYCDTRFARLAFFKYEKLVSDSKPSWHFAGWLVHDVETPINPHESWGKFEKVYLAWHEGTGTLELIEEIYTTSVQLQKGYKESMSYVEVYSGPNWRLWYSKDHNVNSKLVLKNDGTLQSVTPGPQGPWGPDGPNGWWNAVPGNMSQAAADVPQSLKDYKRKTY